MSTHDAEYFRLRRRAREVPTRDSFSGRKFLQRAGELRRLEQLPWPRNLFGEPVSLAELMAKAAQLSEQTDGNPDHVCACAATGIVTLISSGGGRRGGRDWRHEAAT